MEFIQNLILMFQFAYTNDCYGRYKICIQEMKESSKILKQLFEMYKRV